MPKIDPWKLIGLLAALFLISLSLLACGNQAGVIEGTVTQTGDGLSLDQAEILVYGLQRAEGDSQLDVFQKGDVIQREPIAEDGSYRLSLPPGSYIVQVWLGDARLGDRLVEVRAGRETKADFEVTFPNP
ncbi:MAG: hypothetical protein M8467_00415 [Anaerolineae bacterium]|nr:hypothetical protein [Anaerolineae bacterium]